MRDGQFAGYDDSKVTINTQKGPWSMFYPKNMAGQLSQIPPNTMVQFDCSKPPGKNYWRLDSIVAGGGVQAHTEMNPPPIGDSLPPAYSPPAAPAAPPRAVTQDEHIFVTGVVGRSMQSGNFSIEEIPALTAAAVQAFRHWQS